MPADNDDLMWVQAHPGIGSRVALWDKDDAHPNGEVYIAGPQRGEEAVAVEVARTPAVMQALSQQRLQEIRQPKDAGKLREAAAASASPEPPPVDTSVSTATGTPKETPKEGTSGGKKTGTS
jgi:hypothetical protein